MKRIKELAEILKIDSKVYNFSIEEEEKKEEMEIPQSDSEVVIQEESSNGIMDAVIDAVMKVIAETENLKEMLKVIEDEKNKVIEEKQVIEQEVEKTKEELEASRIEKLEKEANDVVLSAIKKGQYVPSLKELKVNQYMNDKESVVKELSLIPELKEDVLLSKNTEKSNGIELEDEKIMVSLKLDPSNQEHISLYKKANKI